MQPIGDRKSCLEVESIDGPIVNLHYQNALLKVPKSLVEVIQYNDALPGTWHGPWQDDEISVPAVPYLATFLGAMFTVSYFRQTRGETLVYLEEASGWVNQRLLHAVFEDEMVRPIVESEPAGLSGFSKYTQSANAVGTNLFWYAGLTVGIFALTEIM